MIQVAAPQSASSPKTQPRIEDDRLHGKVAAALRETGHPHLRRVDVRVRSGKVVLTGFVATYYTKQIAQVAVLGLRDVVDLVNDIEVV